MSDGKQGGGSTLRLIAAFKLCEALLLAAAGLGALGLLQADWQHALVGWLDELSLREGRRLTSEMASKAIDMLGAATVERLVLIAIGCFIYASVFMVEAVGLWLRRRWAEYLTILMTASLLPFEVIELLRQQSLPRILTFAINLLVVAYLIWNLATHRARS
jgi:uncharacterized membrane protein (DUF2068 family)